MVQRLCLGFKSKVFFLSLRFRSGDMSLEDRAVIGRPPVIGTQHRKTKVEQNLSCQGNVLDDDTQYFKQPHEK